MKRVLALAFGTCVALGAMSSASADWAIGGGFENFRWKESTSPEVKESGLRLTADLTWTQSREPGLSAAYNLKFYVGNVDYTGSLLVSNVPISGETHYRGLANEVQSIYRMPQNPVDFVLAAGWDHWVRDLSASQKETYDVLYARLGAALNSGTRQGVFGSAGVKYPFYVRENAHLTDIGFQQNPRLRPDGQFSLFGTLGYRVNGGWDVMAYYDSYRFKQSNTVFVSNGSVVAGFFQPKSRQDVIGLKVQHNF
jgi:hypothetical protein